MAPVLYGWVAFRGAWTHLAARPVAEFVLLSVSVNVLVILLAARLEGRIDQKLSRLISRVSAAHGGLAIFVLFSRHYYSLPMFLAGMVVSFVIGGVCAVMSDPRAARSLAYIGPFNPQLALAAPHAVALSLDSGPIRGFDRVLLTAHGEVGESDAKLIASVLAAGRPVQHLDAFFEEIRGVANVSSFELDHMPVERLEAYRTTKRVLDIALALAIAPVAALLSLVVAGVVLAVMGRPVLFSQPRVGLGGRVFMILKFRTMRPDPAGGGGKATAVSDDRITPLGKSLRRLHLDELPQLWNVLRGDMSLIGPRPEQPALTQAYVRELPAFAFRELVRPGVTGWAQVNAGYAADLAETRIKLGYDLYYLKHMSLGLDLQILGRTVWTLIAGGGVR